MFKRFLVAAAAVALSVIAPFGAQTASANPYGYGGYGYNSGGYYGHDDWYQGQRGVLFMTRACQGEAASHGLGFVASSFTATSAQVRPGEAPSILCAVTDPWGQPVNGQAFILDPNQVCPPGTLLRLTLQDPVGSATCY